VEYPKTKPDGNKDDEPPHPQADPGVLYLSTEVIKHPPHNTYEREAEIGSIGGTSRIIKIHKKTKRSRARDGNA
jgi:hypothetical protein